MTPVQVATGLNISLRAVYNLITSGDLKAVNLVPSDKPGTRSVFRIRRQWMDEFTSRRLVVGRPRPQAPRRESHKALPILDGSDLTSTLLGL